ncbi:MAG: alpha/beta hydrolase [Methanobacterium formicicum]|uniref:Alpha/beta hydrolase n=1 Tax=Methanobacterium formicicum TaxID=2162 RepID=A0A843AV87_METFO|nr:alpha/beta hydrolase [Methanobacterium formicicum]
MPEEFTLTSEYEAEVRDLLFSLLPVSARVQGSIFDIYTSSPEIFNSSNDKNYPFEDIKIPTLIISAQDDPLALPENAQALVERIPHAHLLSLLDGGHPLLGHNEKIKSEITRFLHNNNVSIDI